MLKRTIVLLALVISVGLVRGNQLIQLLTRDYPLEREVGFLMDVENGSAIVSSVPAEDEHGNQSAAQKAGLQKGDRLRYFVDFRGRKHEITGNFSLGEAWREIHYGQPWVAGLERNGKTIEAAIPPTFPTHDFRLKFILLFIAVILPMMAIVTASFIGFLKPEDDHAFVASLLFFSFSSIFSTSHYIFTSGWRMLALIVESALTPWVSYLFMRFFLTFPVSSIIDKKYPKLKTLFLILTIPIGIVGFYATYMMDLSYARIEEMRGTLEILSPIFSVIFLTMFLIGLFSLILNTIRAETLDERRKLRILLAGSVLGLIPLVTFLVYVQATGTRPISPWPLIGLCLLIAIFPLSFVYVVLKHRVLGIRLILRRGIQYALVSRGFFVIEGFILFLVFYFLFERLDVSFSEASGFAGAFMAIVPFGLAMGLKSLNQSVMTAVDRRFFRETYNAHQILSDLGRSLRQLANEPEKLFDLVTDKISDSLYPDKVGIFLKTFGTYGDYQCRGLRVRSGHYDETWCTPESYSGFAFSETSFLAQQLEKSTMDNPETLDVYLDDPKSWTNALLKVHDSDRAHQERQMIERLNVRLIVPLVTNHCLLGYLSLGEKLSEEAYSKEDKKLLLSVADQTAIALEFAKLIKEVAEQEKIKREIQIAKDVQSRLFPQTLPAMDTMEYTGVCRAARGVGGDYYDFLLLSPDRLAIALGDVSGKGISSALLMATLQALLRSAAPLRGESLHLLMSDINRLLYESTLGKKYATFFYSVYDQTEKKLTYVNAGHCPPMIFRTNEPPADSKVQELIRLTTGGMVVGIFPEAEYQFGTISLQSGDLLILYSDGISEAMNEQDEEFGEERLIRVVQSQQECKVSELQDNILQNVSEFVGTAPQSDDMTLVVMRIL